MSRVDHSFTVPADLAACRRKLEADGWEVDAVGEGLDGSQGSQTRMRLLGGNFIAGKHLPKHLSAAPGDGGTSVHLEETVGMGIIGRRFRAKYEAAFAEVERSLRAA